MLSAIRNMCKTTVKRKISLCSALFIGFFLSLNSNLYSQTRTTRFQHLTINDGLPQNMVDCMLQDSQGFLWFGTWNGLCRYDGYNFEIFDNQAASSNGSLRDNFIYSMAEDAYGNLWMGTSQGLQTYLINQAKFQESREYNDLIQGESNSEVRSVVLQNDSTLLVGAGIGLIIFKIINQNGDLQLLKSYSFGLGNNNLSGSIIHDITVDSDSNIWIATNGGITIIPSNNSPLKYFNLNMNSGLSSNQVLSIIESRNGAMLIGTEFGLNKYDKDSDSFISYKSNPSNPNSLIHNSVMDIIEDNSGKIWLATLGGLSVLDVDKNSFSNYKNEYNVKYSLSNDFVNCLLLDDGDNIWIGTERGGVNFFNSNQNVVEHFEYIIDEPNSLSYSTVNSIYEDETYLWIGTAGGGLNRFNKRTEKFRHFRNKPDQENSISSDFITSIIRDNDNRLWIGTWGLGLNILSGAEEGEVDFQNHAGPERQGLVSNFVSSIEKSNNGDLFIGTLGGLVKYDVSNDTYIPFRSNNPAVNITNVGCLLMENKSNLWVGTRNGLYHLQSKTGSFDEQTIVKKYEHDQSIPTSISGDYVISVLKDNADNLWFGTYGQGLNKMIIEDDSVKFSTYSVNEGLSNTIIFGIEQDNDGDIWLSTDYGLSRLNPKTEEIRNFYTVDGLLNNQYYWSASYKSNDGKLYFGGMDGLDTFYPQWINDEKRVSEVVITDLKILNESVVPGASYNGIEVLKENISKTNAIQLSYKETVIGFEFSSLNYQEPGTIRYAYILEGFEKEWNYVSSGRRYASYTNLKPGNYTFKVKASTSNGKFTSDPQEISVIIEPPFWATTWFRVLSVIFLVILVLGYIRLRTYALKKQKALLERQVKDRTEQINTQNLALSNQAELLQTNNNELEVKQKLIEGQNVKLESQNSEILTQHNELKKLNKKLKLVSKLRLSFFTNISHEFRTPLTLIIGPVSKLMEDKSLGLDAKRTLQVMNRNAQRLLHLINQLMDFRKIEKGRMELQVTRDNIEVFCQNIYKAFDPLAEIKNIDFSFTATDLPDEVWFDQHKMENILYNLLSNAFKYTKEGGKVRFELSGLAFSESNLPLSEKISKSKKPVISIKIQDTGVGISEENLPLVFKRFYRIESEEAFQISGSGIGLALTDELIKTHHGEIFVTSHLGEGSVFEIQFPCLNEFYNEDELISQKNEGINVFEQVEILKNEFLANENAEDAQISEIANVDKEKPKILVVEDNKDLRKFIAQRLERKYHVAEAFNGNIGIEKAIKWSPDLIISDVMMPEVNGLELCDRLKNNLETSHIPIILLTAKSEIADQITGLKIGADDYLSKPFNFDLLEARVTNLIEAKKKLRLQFLESADFKLDDVGTNFKDQKFLELCIKAVEDQMENPDFGVKEFVDSIGISRSLLHKKLTSLTGQSSGEFINHLRMKKAQQLLRKNELNISEVAYAVGYNDPKYFTRLFNKYFGQSPKDFQNSELTL